jgi:hypothetical protein
MKRKKEKGMESEEREINENNLKKQVEIGRLVKRGEEIR